MRINLSVALQSPEFSEGLANTLRLELLNTQIQLSVIQPGPIESEFRANAYKAFSQHIDMDNSDYQATLSFSATTGFV
jgi:short-subunit dehydrogenase